MRRMLRVILFLALPLSASLCATAQGIHIPPNVAQTQGTGNPPVTSGDDAQQQQARAAYQQRQMEIRRDTEKMSELIQELKDELARNSAATVSVDAIKKAEQIEKLARGVKSKMKQSF